MTSYSVARRTSEIGIRVALGARHAQVLWLILRQVLIVPAVGLSIGLPAALLAAPLVRSLLFGLAPADPTTMAAAAVAILAVSLVAGLLPARRAARMDALAALKQERHATDGASSAWAAARLGSRVAHRHCLRPS